MEQRDIEKKYGLANMTEDEIRVAQSWEKFAGERFGLNKLKELLDQEREVAITVITNINFGDDDPRVTNARADLRVIKKIKSAIAQTEVNKKIAKKEIAQRVIK